MNKRTTRAFAFGIIFAVLAMTVFTYTKGMLKEKKISLQEAKSTVEAKGYTILSKEEYQKLTNQVKSVKKPSTQNTPASKKPSQNNSAKQETTKIAYILNISEGMSPEVIASLLEKDHIIKDKNSFIKYLNTHKLSTKVQVGTYKLTNEMNEEEIAKIITK